MRRTHAPVSRDTEACNTSSCLRGTDMWTELLDMLIFIYDELKSLISSEPHSIHLCIHVNIYVWYVSGHVWEPGVLMWRLRASSALIILLQCVTWVSSFHPGTPLPVTVSAECFSEGDVRPLCIHALLLHTVISLRLQPGPASHASQSSRQPSYAVQADSKNTTEMCVLMKFLAVCRYFASSQMNLCLIQWLQQTGVHVM